MDNKTLSVQEQEAIIAEYLLGEISYRSLGKKYRIDFRLIHSPQMAGQAVGNEISRQSNTKIYCYF